MNWYCCICYSDDSRVYDVPVQVLSCFWASSVSFWAKQRAIFSKQSEMIKQVSGCAEWLTVPKGWIQDCCAFRIWWNFSCGSSSIPRSFVRIAIAAINVNILITAESINQIISIVGSNTYKISYIVLRYIY